MKKNMKKGISLAELLAVVVIMGILAAIAIPLVGNVIENSRKSAVYADAVTIKDAANLFITEQQNSFDNGTILTEQQLQEYVSTNFDFVTIADPAVALTEGQVVVYITGTNTFDIAIYENGYLYVGDVTVDGKDEVLKVDGTSGNYDDTIVLNSGSGITPPTPVA